MKVGDDAAAFLSSDPTYKEWKHLWRFEPTGIDGNRSDPTYKEWKLTVKDLVSGEVISGSDPTYKEWKPRRWMMRNRVGAWARILPTRNGNPCFLQGDDMGRVSSDPTYKEWKPLYIPVGEVEVDGARILPTRNGNRINSTAK